MTCFFQDYSKECVAHVQKYLMKLEVPPNLFEVCIYSAQYSLNSSYPLKQRNYLLLNCLF